MKRQTKFGIVLAAAAVISVSIASLVSARGWVQEGSEWRYVDNNNEYVTGTIQSSGNSKFYLNDDGYMVRNYFLEDYNDNTYYFGANGAMVTNTWVAIDAANVENQDDYVPDNYWYYFQASGKAMKAAAGSVKKTTIDGKKYGFNEYGQMCVGWFGNDGKTINPDDESNPFINAVYYAGGDNDGVLRSGWVTYYDGYDGDDEYQTDYTNLYFYFNTSNNKKYGNDGATTKKINGRTYAFNDEGIMLSGWDVYENRDALNILTNQTTYFSGEDDGHQVKKGWVYAVPSASIDADANSDDEEKYMYFNNSGSIVADQFKKINGKYYVFNRNGIMKDGVVVWCPSGTSAGNATTSQINKYVTTLDLDWANGEDIAKKGILRYDSGDTQYIKVDTTGKVTAVPAGAGDAGVRVGESIKLHYFGSDGARRTGLNNIEFADDTYTLNTVGSTGDKGTGVFSKKYYSLGILLKASGDIRYGIYQQASDSMLKAQSGEYAFNLDVNNYLVLTTSGAKQKGNNTAKKDSDGNFWMIDRATNALKGIYTVGIKANNTLSNFATKHLTNVPREFRDGGTYSTAFIASTLGNGNGVFADEWSTIADDNGNLDDMTWTCHRVQNSLNGEYYFTGTYVGGCYQSDYAEGSNKWIPMGMLDNALVTATFNHSEADEDNQVSFNVTPNNDYFVNCYWAD